MKRRIYYGFTLTLLSFILCLAPVWAQNSYRITINNGQAFNVTGGTTQLVENIYKRIKPSGSHKPTITLPLGNTNLKSFQNLVKSKGISAEYYEVLQSTLSYKAPKNRINPSSIRSTNKNYGVTLTKPGYQTAEEIPFKVTKISNNIPALSFSMSTLKLVDETSISFILDTGNSGLNRNQIGNAIKSKDIRLSPDPRNLQEYKSCLDSQKNPARQSDCGSPRIIKISQ